MGDLRDVMSSRTGGRWAIRLRAGWTFWVIGNAVSTNILNGICSGGQIYGLGLQVEAE